MGPSFSRRRPMLHPHVIALVIHVICASIWLGSAFFGAWFLMPAIADLGPDGGKVMGAVQKRGWIVVVPVIATLTLLSGFYMYRQYMGVDTTQAKMLGYGGISGLLAYVLGIAVVSRSLSKAMGLTQKAMTMPDG